MKRKRQAILGVLIGAVAVVGVRSYKGLRKFSSADVGVLALVATFVLAVETAKSYLAMLQENLAQIAAAWRHHRSLRLLQSDRPLAAGGPAVPAVAAGACTRFVVDLFGWLCGGFGAVRETSPPPQLNNHHHTTPKKHKTKKQARTTRTA